MKGYAQAVVVGNLVKDPEVRQTGGGRTVVNFSMAVNTSRGSEEQVSYFDVTAWEGLGDTIAQHKKKGDAILVQGNLRQERWESNGQNRSKVAITAREVTFLPRGGETTQGGSSAGGRRKQKNNEEDFLDIAF